MPVRLSIAGVLVVTVAATFLSLAPGASCSRRRRERGGENSPETAPAPTPELKVEDLVVGSGQAAAAGAMVSIHYKGTLNGALFDSSFNRQPLQFRLGNGEVLPGWDFGIVGMKVGGKRRLTVPPGLGYGHKGSPGGAIPPDSVLVFEIDLLNAKY